MEYSNGRIMHNGGVHYQPSAPIKNYRRRTRLSSDGSVLVLHVLELENQKVFVHETGEIIEQDDWSTDNALFGAISEHVHK